MRFPPPSVQLQDVQGFNMLAHDVAQYRLTAGNPRLNKRLKETGEICRVFVSGFRNISIQDLHFHQHFTTIKQDHFFLQWGFRELCWKIRVTYHCGGLEARNV